MKYMIYILVAVFLVGCSSGPDDAILKEVIEKALLTEHLPPAFVGKNMLGGYAKNIEEIEIEDKSYEKEEPNQLMKVLGQKPKYYWLVNIRTKGIAQIGYRELESPQNSTKNEHTRQFHLRLAVKVYEKEDGDLEVSIPTVF